MILVDVGNIVEHLGHERVNTLQIASISDSTTNSHGHVLTRILFSGGASFTVYGPSPVVLARLEFGTTTCETCEGRGYPQPTQAQIDYVAAVERERFHRGDFTSLASNRLYMPGSCKPCHGSGVIPRTE